MVSHCILCMPVLKKLYIFEKNLAGSVILIEHSYFSRWYLSAKELKEHPLLWLRVPCLRHLHMKKSMVYS